MTCFLKHKLVKCPYLWQILHWHFLAGNLNPSTSIFLYMSMYGIRHFHVMWSLLLTCLLYHLLPCGCGLKAFFLHLPGRRSVCWCLIKLISVALGSLATCLMCLAVALDASNFFASWLTLLAGHLSRWTLLSLMVLNTNSSSLRKYQKISWCKTFTVSYGYLERLTWACTALYHSSTDLLICCS